MEYLAGVAKGVAVVWCSAGQEGVLLLEMSFTITGAAPAQGAWSLVVLKWERERTGSKPYNSRFILSPCPQLHSSSVP